MTTKQSLKDTPQPLLEHRIDWLKREKEHVDAELKAAREELRRRKV